MEFFSRDIRQPDAALLETMMTAGAQIGLYVARKWAADELETFFSLSLDLLCVASLDGYFLRLNPAWTQVFGFDEAELRASPFLDFVHPDDRAATTRRGVGADGRSPTDQFREPVPRARRIVRWLEWAAAPSLDQGVIYAAARDVTDRKRADEALKESTRAISKQLVRGARRGPAEGRSGGGRQGRVPREHEPRDPHADERGDRHDRSRAAHAAHAAAARVHSDRQRVGRGAADDPQRHPRRLEDRGGPADARSRRRSASATPSRTRSSCSRRARDEKRLELACHILPDVPDALVGDPGRLRQVLVNLVGNAIKFTERRRGRRRSRRRSSVTDAEAVLEFTVSDTGIGIAPDKQWQIFGAFVQADASTTRRFGGTGLGLTISADLVEMMGGRIWVTSEEGRGSQFRFVADVRDPAAAPRRGAAVAPRTCATSACSSWTTTPPIAPSCRRCSPAGGCEPTAVDSAAAALAALDEAVANAARRSTWCSPMR